MFRAILALLLVARGSGSGRGCEEINKALSINAACRCYLSSPSPSSEGRWIGCQSIGAPEIKSALEQIPEGTVVDKLWLWRNVIPMVKDDPKLKIFMGNVKAKKLVIESSQLSFLDWKAFGVLNPELEVLELRNNRITDIPDGIFDQLTNLRQLDLSGNGIKKISKNLFSGKQENAGKLEILSISQNHISDIEAGSFRKLKNLKRLNLAKNSLTELSDGVFEGLGSLEHLTLDENNLRAVRSDVFSDLMELQRLNVQDNNISSISLDHLSKLEKLYAANNKLRSIENLKLKNVPSLNNLNLDRNQIGSLTESKTLEELSSLRILSLTHNKITLIRGMALNPLTQLQTLSLQHNQLVDLPDYVFSHLGRLKNLFLQQNLLRNIGENALDGLKSAVVISLAHNNIDDLHPDAFKGLSSLTKLFINDNDLSALSNRSLAALDTLRTLDVADNPWLCDCALEWMGEWASDGRIDLENQNTQCTTPRREDMASALNRLAEMCEGGFPKKDDNAWITVLGIVLAVLSLMVLGAIVILYLRDHHSVRRIYALQRVPSDMKLLVREG